MSALPMAAAASKPIDIRSARTPVRPSPPGAVNAPTLATSIEATRGTTVIRIRLTNTVPIGVRIAMVIVATGDEPSANASPSRNPPTSPISTRMANVIDQPSCRRFLRGFRLTRTVEGDRLANERFEGGLVNGFAFVDVDRAACVAVEARVEEMGRILQRGALDEGQLHDLLVGFARADDAVVRPHRSAHPLPLLYDIKVGFLDERAHSAKGFAAPVSEFGDSFRDEVRRRLAPSIFLWAHGSRSLLLVWLLRQSTNARPSKRTPGSK